MVVFWEVILRWNPKNRFHDLAGDMRILTASVIFCLKNTPKGDSPFIDADTIERISTISYKLRQLDIKHPPEKDLFAWHRLLPCLTSCAETKDLKGAKEI